MKLIRHPYFLLLLILCAAFLIRTINLKDNILFAYDQARDAQRIYNMVYKGDIKIVGPETDIQGIFNGPLFYYALAPVYYFSNFDPNAAALLFIFINVLTILLVFWSAKILFNKDSIALVASLLWAFSYEQGFFSRYISNASPMSTTTTIFFIGLALFFLKKKQGGLPLSAVGIALAIHCNFYFIYLFLFYPLFFILFRQKPHIKAILYTLLALVLLLSPWIITEFKWKFIGVRSLFSYFIHQGTSATSDSFFTFFISFITRYYDRISQGIYFSFIPYKFIGFIAVTFLTMWTLIKKRTPAFLFLLLWLINTLPLFAFKSGVHSVEVINGSVFVPFTLLFAFGIIELTQYTYKKIPVFSILFTTGIIFYGLQNYIKYNFIPYSVQSSMPSLLIHAKKSIDYTYEKAQRKEFGICAISEPLFMNTVWSFLYSTYGKQKYGYVPYWTGQQQTLNESFIPYAHKKFETKFILQEPMYGIPAFAPRATYYIEDTYNHLIEQKSFGAYTVQMRKVKNVPPSTNQKKYTEQQRKSIQEDVDKVPQFSCDIVHVQ